MNLCGNFLISQNQLHPHSCELITILGLLATPKTPYTTPRRLTATDIQRTTPRKELDKMLVKDLRLLYLLPLSFSPHVILTQGYRLYLQTQGLKYDDKRSALLNRIMRHHKQGKSPPLLSPPSPPLTSP